MNRKKKNIFEILHYESKKTAFYFFSNYFLEAFLHPKYVSAHIISRNKKYINIKLTYDS